jgi:hypothetical protein
MGDMKLICEGCGGEIILDDSPAPFEFEPVDTVPICDRCRQTDASQHALGPNRNLAA